MYAQIRNIFYFWLPAVSLEELRGILQKVQLETMILYLDFSDIKERVPDKYHS